METITQQLLTLIVIFEFILITLIVCITYFFRIYSFITKKYRVQTEADLEHYLKTVVSQGKIPEIKTFPQKWKKIYLLLKIIKRLNAHYEKSNNWEKIKDLVVYSILLPLAREASNNNKNWVLRFFSAEVFALNTQKQDEPLIIKLVRDPIQLVSLRALTSALNSGSETAINNIIERMSEERILTQSIYLRIFHNAPLPIRDLVENILTRTSEKKPYLRATCYRVLFQFPPTKIHWNITADLFSKNLELKLSSLKYLAYADTSNSIEILYELLQDPSWKVRLSVMNILTTLNLPDSIPYIKLAQQDPHWRVSACAQRFLNALKKKTQKLNFHTVHHV